MREGSVVMPTIAWGDLLRIHLFFRVVCGGIADQFSI
jgi:hypothetical protein